jgi:hypothetical protein
MILTILFIIFLIFAIIGTYPGTPVSAYSAIFGWLALAILGYKVLGGHP